jgi:ribosome-binding protein aMBF1 (putative translation factor)
LDQGKECEVTGETVEQIQREMGAEIRNARERLRMTQLCLAAELGCQSYQFVSLIEQGRYALPKKHVIKVASVLGLSQDKMVDQLLKIQRLKLMRGVVRND